MGVCVLVIVDHLHQPYVWRRSWKKIQQPKRKKKKKWKRRKKKGEKMRGERGREKKAVNRLRSSPRNGCRLGTKKKSPVCTVLLLLLLLYT